MNARIADQLRAQGIDPKTRKPLLEAQRTPVAASRPVERPTTPPKNDKAVTGRKTDKTPVALRPRFQEATTGEYEGRKMVFFGLSPEQTERLRVYAKTLGILEQN